MTTPLTLSTYDKVWSAERGPKIRLYGICKIIYCSFGVNCTVVLPEPPDLMEDDRLELRREFFSVWLAASAAAKAAASSSILRLIQYRDI
jgi:hypothetical protein